MPVTPVAWPSGVPQRVRRDGFTMRQTSPVLRTDMDVGAKQRRRTTFAPVVFDVQFAWTSAQLALFRVWLAGPGEGGARPVLWRDPVIQVDRAVRIVGGQDLQIAPHPQMAGRWLVTLSLETTTSVTIPTP